LLFNECGFPTSKGPKSPKPNDTEEKLASLMKLILKYVNGVNLLYNIIGHGLTGAVQLCNWALLYPSPLLLKLGPSEHTGASI